MADIKPPTSSSESQAPSTQLDGDKIKTSMDQLEEALRRTKEYAKGAEGSAKKATELEAKLTDLLGKASESQAKADNEALRANQAKLMVEEHSNAVAKLKGAIEADAATISAKRAEIENIAQGFTNLRSSSESDTTSITNARRTADEATKAITETSGKAAAIQANITETKKSIDLTAQTVRDETKGVLADISQITATKDTSMNLLATIQKTTATISELHERTKTAHESIEVLEKAAKAKTEAVAELVEKSLVLQQAVTEYESSLTRLQGEFAAMKDKVERLLPGATSAGLASSFCIQKQRFRAPRLAWMTSFFVCISLLMVIAINVGGWPHTSAPNQTWDEIWRQLLQHVPYIFPLVWLGIYSGRQYMMSLRMEEDYAYKEAVSTSFEGYKREMASNPEAANSLCTQVLATVARRPGLIYEGEQNDVTPLTPAVDAIQKLIPKTVETVMAKLKGPINGG